MKTILLASLALVLTAPAFAQPFQSATPSPVMSVFNQPHRSIWPLPPVRPIEFTQPHQVATTHSSPLAYPGDDWSIDAEGDVTPSYVIPSWVYGPQVPAGWHCTAEHGCQPIAVTQN